MFFWMSGRIELAAEEHNLCAGKEGAAWFGIRRSGLGHWVIIENNGRIKEGSSEKGATEPATSATSTTLLGAG